MYFNEQTIIWIHTFDLNNLCIFSGLLLINYVIEQFVFENCPFFVINSNILRTGEQNSFTSLMFSEYYLQIHLKFRPSQVQCLTNPNEHE